MHLIDLIRQQQPFLSLEFFPPKERSQWPAFFDVVRQLKALDPLFCSVTYGAGGGTQHNTLEIVTRLKQEYGLEPLTHLTCVGADAARIRAFLEQMRQGGVNNVLALRGDPPQGNTTFVPDNEDFQHGNDLVTFIRQTYPDLCIGVAGYPETHPQAPSAEVDLTNLKRKVDAGADFIITQLFFDNDIYFDFVARAQDIGIAVPIVPGVLPVANLGALKRMLSFCGATVPTRYLQDLEHVHAQYGDSGVRGLGLGYAKNQIRDLLDRGAPGVHLYTLNKADTCLEIWKEFKASFGAK